MSLEDIKEAFEHDQGIICIKWSNIYVSQELSYQK